MTIDFEPRSEPNPKWIRGVRGGQVVVDSRASRLVWTHQYYPAWAFWADDVVSGTATEPTAQLEELDGFVQVPWDAVDQWYEEDVEVFVHPRDPYKRIDTLASSRHVRVFIEGQLVADTHKPILLFETLLPERYYIPAVDVRFEHLTPTETSSGCPYKGWANYWTVTVDGVDHSDIAWGYRTPLPESEAVAGHVCFYNEKVDIEVDGEMLVRPATKFS